MKAYWTACPLYACILCNNKGVDSRLPFSLGQITTLVVVSKVTAWSVWPLLGISCWATGWLRELIGSRECQWRLARYQSLYKVAVQLGLLAGLGGVCWLLGRGVSLGRGDARPWELLLVVGGGFLLVRVKARAASQTLGGLQPLSPFSFIVVFFCSHVLICWPLLFSSRGGSPARCRGLQPLAPFSSFH